MNEALFSKGIDAWWMDATEPELVGEGTPGALKAAMNPTALGSGARMANAYVLPSSQAVYEGQRAADPDKRVFILTRSAFAGSQRYAAATWSGDVSSDWDSLRKQIPAGLNMALSGIPWWTTDVGGFAVPRKWSGSEPAARGRRGVARARDALVPVRHVLPAAARARAAAVPRDVVLRRRRGPSGLQDPARVRPAALPDAALHLLAGGGRDAPRTRR